MIYALLIGLLISMNAIPTWMAGDPYRDGKLNLFFLCSIFPVASWLSRRFDLFLGLAFASWMAIWCLYDSEGYGFVPALGIPLFLATAEWAARRPIAFSWVLRITVWIQLALVPLHLAGFYPFETSELIPKFAGRPIGTMGNETLLAAFLAGMVPFSAVRWTALESFLLMGGVFATGSTMGAISMMIGLAAAAWKNQIRWPAICAGGGSALLACLALTIKPGGEFFSLSGRAMLWPIAWEASLSRPLGWGPGAWAGLYPMWGVPTGEWVQIHNDVLQLFHEGGWQTGVLVAIALYRIMGRMDAAAFGGSAALLMNACGNFTFHFPPTAFMFSFYLASAKQQEVQNGRKGSLRRKWRVLAGWVRSLDQPAGKPKNSRRARIPKAEKADS